MTELTIGDEGPTNNGCERYLIVAEHAGGGLIAALSGGGRPPSLKYVSTAGVGAYGLRCLPPKPKADTLRRWLWVRKEELCAMTSDSIAYRSVTRPADITYTLDGRIESIVFVDEPESPKSLDLRVGDVVRLRNNLMDVIRSTDGNGGDSVQPIVGDQFEWWEDGRYRLTREKTERDIMEIVSRGDSPPRKVDAETFGIIWERLRKVSDAWCYNDLREAVDDVVATLEDAGWGGEYGQQ